MEFRLLGELEVEGVPKATLGGPKQRALLAYLLLHANEFVPRDRLVDAVWGENPPPTARSIVHGYVRKLRAALEDTSAEIASRSQGYVLDLDPDEVDVRRFERLAKEGRKALVSGNPERAQSFLADGLALWRGEAFADLVYEPSVEAEARRLADLRLEATMDRVDAELALGGNGLLVGELESLVSLHPYIERLRGQLMIALYRGGRQADALDAYRAAQGALAQDLGIQPGPELQRLQRAILRQDRELDSVEPTPASESSRTLRPVRLTIVAVAVVGALAAILAWTMSSGKSASLPIPANHVGVIDTTSNRVVAAVPTGTRPGPVVAAAGSIWVANLTDETLTRIDPRGRRVDRTISLNAFPSALAAGLDSIWVVDAYSSSVARVSPDANAVLWSVDMPYDPQRYEHGCSGTPEPVRAAIAVVGSNAVAMCPSGVETVVDGRTRANRAVDIDVLDPSAIAYGVGSVWIASWDNNTITQLDPTTSTKKRTLTVASNPGAVAATNDSIWVASFREPLVTRIRFPGPALPPTAQTIRISGTPVAIAAGQGAVWVAAKNHTVSRIDPNANRVAATIEIGKSVPAGLAVAPGTVWVTAQAP